VACSGGRCAFSAGAGDPDSAKKYTRAKCAQTLRCVQQRVCEARDAHKSSGESSVRLGRCREREEGRDLGLGEICLNTAKVAVFKASEVRRNHPTKCAREFLGQLGAVILHGRRVGTDAPRADGERRQAINFPISRQPH
jgi:hypothetical protein